MRRGDRIADPAANRLEVPALLLAAMRLGAAVVPLNPTTGPADWDYVARRTRRRARSSARRRCSRASIGRPRRVCAFEDEPAPTPGRAAVTMSRRTGRPARAGDGRRLYTSGTTGNPKGVALAQGSLLANAWSMAVELPPRRSDPAGGAAALSRPRARLRADDGADDRRPPRLHGSLRPVRLGRDRSRREGHADQRGADVAAAAAAGRCPARSRADAARDPRIVGAADRRGSHAPSSPRRRSR